MQEQQKITLSSMISPSMLFSGIAGLLVNISFTIFLRMFINLPVNLALFGALLLGMVMGLRVYAYSERLIVSPKLLLVLLAGLIIWFLAAWFSRMLTGVPSLFFQPFGTEISPGLSIFLSIVQAVIIYALVFTIPVPQSIYIEVKTLWLEQLVWMLKWIGYVFFFTLVFFPFYYLVIISLKPRAELLQSPTNMTLDLNKSLSELFNGYVSILVRFKIMRNALNSLFISTVSIIFTLIPAIFGAYAVARLKFPGRDFFSKIILIVYMFPSILVVIPLYGLFAQLQIRDTFLSLLLVYPTLTVPVSLYMLRSYFISLPASIEEAGLIDGLTRLGVIMRITLPLSIPAIVTVVLYIFIIVWNEFLFSFMLIDSQALYTLSRAVAALNTQEVPRQFLMAGAVFITIPGMVLVFWLQRFIVGGLAAGSVKG